MVIPDPVCLAAVVILTCQNVRKNRKLATFPQRKFLKTVETRVFWSILSHVLTLQWFVFRVAHSCLTADPTPAWIAIPGLLGLTVLVILLASLRIRRTEINYGAE
jgi:hypothetical protein